MTDKSKQSSKDKISARSSLVEEQIKNAQKKREEKLFLEELGKRISIARQGKMSMEKGNFPNALTNYRRFLSLTAKAMKVEVDDLSPNLFEEKARLSESLLISAIFMDLMKMLDLVKTPAAKDERGMYHKLFIRFTLGQPFQAFAAENLRKYISSSKLIQNKKEFLNTYNRIQLKKACLVATWAFENEDAPEVIALRFFRDTTLNQNVLGRYFISFYYLSAPIFREALSLIPGARLVVRKSLSLFVRSISIK